MGNMPNKWVGRAAAVILAALSGVVGWSIGAWIGDKLAYGFTFDWYVHETHPAYELAEVLPHVASTAVLAALLSVTIGVFSTAAVTRLFMKRMRYTPPRYSQPVSTDVHFGRLALFALVAAPLLAVLVAYVLLASPLFVGRATGAGGSVIQAISPGGFQLLVAGASALFSALGTFLANLTTEAGVVSGRIVRKSDRNLIARISLFGMRNAKTTIALVIGVTMLAGAYAKDITTNVDVADVLPRGDPNTIAAHNLTEEFKSSFTQQVTFQFRAIDAQNASQVALYQRENAEKLPDRVTDSAVQEGSPQPGALTNRGLVGRPENITDELYIRAISEMMAFVTAQEPFAGSVGTPDFYKLINWTIAGGQNATDSDFGLPDTTREGELQYATVEAGVLNVEAVFSAVDAVTSPDWRQTAVLVTVGSEYDGSTKHIGERALEVREMWLQKVKAGETEFEIFGPENPPLFSVDLPIANAHASELTAHDFKLLLPIIGIFIAMTLFIAFRNTTSVIATFSMLAIAVLWTFGVMGAMRIPLNTINLATVPLIMGIGIDYGIHMMNEYQELRHEGKSPEQAWIAAGGGSALALFVGLVTTLTGLIVMVISPSLLVAQLGILAMVAIASCYVLAVLFLPAVVTLLGERGPDRMKRIQYAPSRVMPMLATGVSRARWGVALVLVLIAGASIGSASNIQREAFGDPPRNWLEDDELRLEHAEAIEGFYARSDDAVKANVLIIEGDLTDPAVHAYINNLTGTFRQHTLTNWTDANNASMRSRVIGDTLRDLPFLLNTYLTVRDGAPGAAQFLGATGLNERFAQAPAQAGGPPVATYPESREEMKDLLDEVFRSPLFQFGNLFVNAPEYDMTVIVFSVNATTYKDAEAVWNEVQAAIAANAALKPEGTQVSFFGNTAINYLFVAKQVPWLGYMSAVTVIAVSIIVFAFTRDIRATSLVTLLNGLTSAVWIGLLPSFGIGLAINLTLPLVFIFCMGSDYGLHLAMRCRRTKDTYATFEGVGKGVLFSFLTTWGAFLVFTQISDLAGRRGMIATAIAIAVVFLTTLLVVPIFYPVRKKDVEKREGSRSIPLVETRRIEVWQGDRRTVLPAMEAAQGD